MTVLLLLAIAALAGICLKDTDTNSPDDSARGRTSVVPAPSKALSPEEQKIADLEAKAKAIPAVNVQANLEAYQELLELDPENTFYREKVAYYQSPEAEERANQLRAAAQRRKEQAELKAQATRRTDAWIMAQQFIEKRLKAPSTAEWGSVWKGTYQSPDDCVSLLGDNKYLCKGWVDSQNSFGAMIRTQFSCVVEYMGDDRWALSDLETW